MRLTGCLQGMTRTMPISADTKGMTMFNWKAEYAVGHPDIDSQHKRLFQLAAELHSSMLAGHGKEILNRVLNNLISYTKHHFAAEEQLMADSGYPDYLQHKAKHDQLTAQVVEFQKDFVAGRTAITVDLLQFLSNWLQHHIGLTDRKIAAYLHERSA